MNQKKNEMVNHPDHYKGDKIECIEAMIIEYGPGYVIAFCILNAFKYIWRADKKGKEEEDLKKAQWYIDKAKELQRKYNLNELDLSVEDYKRIIKEKYKFL